MPRRYIVVQGGARARSLAIDHADGHLGLVREGGHPLTSLAYDSLAVLTGPTGKELDLDDSTIQPTERRTQGRVAENDLARDRVHHAIGRYRALGLSGA